MSIVMVTYEVIPEQVAENVRLVQAVYGELAESEPEGLSYATFQLDGGARFAHIASVRGDGENPLRGVRAFAEFQADIGARCVVAPVTTGLVEVGSYRAWG